jgi:hypothetical protein
MRTSLPQLSSIPTHQSIDPQTGAKTVVAVHVPGEAFNITLPDIYEDQDFVDPSTGQKGKRKVRVAEGGTIRGGMVDVIARRGDGCVFVIKAQEFKTKWVPIQ